MLARIALFIGVVLGFLVVETETYWVRGFLSEVIRKYGNKAVVDPERPWVIANVRDADVAVIQSQLKAVPGHVLRSIYRCSRKTCGYDGRFAIITKTNEPVGRWELDGAETRAVRDIMLEAKWQGSDLSDLDMNMVPEKTYIFYFVAQVDVGGSKPAADILKEMDNNRDAQLKRIKARQAAKAQAG